AVDDKLYALAVAEIEQRLTGDAALSFAAMREVIDAAEREHLRAIFPGRHMADRLALGAHSRAFCAEVAVGVDLKLDAAIAVDALGDDRHHVDPVGLGGNNEGGGLIVGIGGAGADSGDQRNGPAEDVAAPGRLDIDERHNLAAFADGAVEEHMRIDPHQLAVLVGVAVARAGHPRSDVTEHRTGVAADLAVDLVHVPPPAAARLAYPPRPAPPALRPL